MPAFVQVSEDQNSAVLWPERPTVLKFEPSSGQLWHDCQLCEYCNTSPDDCRHMPCGTRTPDETSRYPTRTRADGRIGYFTRIT
jgi:hypothetical protein